MCSPNTPGLRDWQKKEHLEDLLKIVIAARNSCLKKPPIVLKLAPDLSLQEKKDITDIIKKPEVNPVYKFVFEQI